MSTYTQIIYQIVFSTKDRKSSLDEENRKVLFKYIWGILKAKKCHLYQIGGVGDHIHIITHIHPSVAVADMVKDIKLASNRFINKEGVFPKFDGWQDGYGAFTYSIREKDNLIAYVKNQKEHHKAKSFREEYLDLLKELGVEFDEKYLL